MPIFFYEAIDEKGATLKGTMEADSPAALEGMLAARGHISTLVKEKKGGAADFFQGGGILDRLRELTDSFTINDLIIFTKQFRSMLRAGVPILRVFQVLESQTPNRMIRGAITQIMADIRQGSTLYGAIDKHPRIFSPLYRSMIRAGEASGNVPDILGRLLYIIEHEAKVKADVKAALQYPIIVLISLGLAFVILLTFVIPKFVQVFKTARLELPLPTKIAIFMYDFFSNYWLLILGAILAIVLGLWNYFKTEAGRLTLDKILLRIPLLGPLFLKAALSRFASIFAMLHASGINVMTAMSIVSDTIGNKAISNQLDKVSQLIREGQGISKPLQSARYFTPMVIDMIAIGEESGRIDEMLREVTEHYDDEVT
ncbi:MAG: type II secretion system F family protein, partial [Smithellaceae bacterium]|nr:type II secretion system F family protein [Smithellaceae bacterium]